MPLNPIQRYQRAVKEEKGPRYSATARTYHDNPEWDVVQRTCRMPRWVLRTLQRQAEEAGEPEAAVIRAWLMDAAEAWLSAHGLAVPDPP